MKVAVTYDYYDDGIKPYTMVVILKPGELDWALDKLYIPLETPFTCHSQLFNDDEPGISVFLSELVINPERPDCFGIYLPSVKLRIQQTNIQTNDIQHFIVQMADIEEVLHMGLKQYYDWR